MSQQTLSQLEQQLGIYFKNKKLLTKAFTHRSYLNESNQEKQESNERLEFLGDSVLSLVISEHLYRQYPNIDEGQLTNYRSSIVAKKPLSQISRSLGLGNYLFLSKGEDESGGRQNSSILADSCEAFIGALFLDQGVDIVKRFINRYFIPKLDLLIKKGAVRDYKSQLQEKIQAIYKKSPIYKTIKTQGPDHKKTFMVGVWANGQLLAQGNGKSKQEAQQSCARQALANL